MKFINIDGRYYSKKHPDKELHGAAKWNCIIKELGGFKVVFSLLLSSINSQNINTLKA
ncbi:Uncharacterised protein [Helicobacter fennelliae]|uniref:Uncharacterized protein n=1 Tax=Helicobacter fennelliae TaxID=215 RepID=A0A2X3ERE1_9HELI|nr:hypothetical protein [Helicobacter fennelliae]SQC36295.1 Uncharacterised protein [Helicobacter fennelliae]